MSETNANIVSSRRSIRVVAVLMLVMALALAVIATFDHDATARIPVLPRALGTSVLCYAVVAALAWFLSTATDLASALTGMRYLLLTVMGAYATSFVPLALYAVPAVLTVALAGESARALRWPLRGFIALSFALGACALLVAVRSEVAFRARLEGLIMFASLAEAAWHFAAGGLAVAFHASLGRFLRDTTPGTSEQLTLAYRRTWLFSAAGITAVVIIFAMTAIFVQLERSSGPPR